MIIDELLELLNQDSEEKWSRSLFALAEGYGFEQTLFALLENKYKPIEKAYIKSNYSKQWRTTYDKEKLGNVDPTVKHCLDNATPMVWSDKVFSSKAQKNMLEEAASFGLRSGIILPIHGPKGEFGMISFVSQNLEKSAQRKNLINALPELAIIRDYAFESSKNFYFPQVNNNALNLTPRELEVLKWSMAGKTSWETSMILNCSESTVNFHLSNLRQKFTVNTTQQVVVRAIKMGILNP